MGAAQHVPRSPATPPLFLRLSQGDPWEKNKLLSGKGGSRGGTSSFGAGGGRGAASVGSMATNLDTLLFGAPVAAGKPDAGPGPGAYELQDFASIRSKLSRQGQRPSPAFQFPEHSQRWVGGWVHGCCWSRSTHVQA